MLLYADFSCWSFSSLGTGPLKQWPVLLSKVLKSLGTSFDLSKKGHIMLRTFYRWSYRFPPHTHTDTHKSEVMQHYLQKTTSIFIYWLIEVTLVSKLHRFKECSTSSSMSCVAFSPPRVISITINLNPPLSSLTPLPSFPLATTCIYLYLYETM